MVDMNRKDEKYLLKVGPQGQKRLTILNKVYNPFSYQFLESLNIKKGMRVLEVGCGTGEISLWLSTKVGETGRVVAIDKNIEQIKLAQIYSHVDNLEFLNLSIYDINELNQSFDLIYCRFVLAHLTKPLKALEVCRKSLKPGGFFACEESTVQASFCYPQNAVFDLWLNIWNNLKQTHGLPLNLGLELPSLLQQAQYANIKCSLAQPVLRTPEEKSLLRLNILESLDVILSKGYMIKEDVDRWVSRFLDLENDPSAFIGFVRNTQVLGVKL